jgi:transcriptional regulator with XRE-family HTH domain
MAVDWEALRELVDEAMARHHMTVRALALAAGMSHGTINQIRNRKAVPLPSTLRKLAPWLNVSDDVLLELAGHATPKGARPRPRSRDAMLDELRAVDAIEVPFYEVTASASSGREIFNEEPYSYRYLPMRGRYRKGRIKGLTVRGNCLSTLRDGDEVFIDTEPDYDEDDIVLAVVGDALHLKRLRSIDDGWELAPDNGEPSMPIADGVYLLGRVIGVWHPIEGLWRRR